MRSAIRDTLDELEQQRLSESDGEHGPERTLDERMLAVEPETGLFRPDLRSVWSGTVWPGAGACAVPGGHPARDVAARYRRRPVVSGAHVARHVGHQRGRRWTRLRS